MGKFDGVTVTVTDVQTREKKWGGYVQPKRKTPSGEWVPDYSVRGYYERNERDDKTRVYVHAKEWSVAEHLVNRYSRPHAMYRLAFPEMFRRLGIEPVKARWSQKAGCSCGCSPAFILDARLRYDVWLTIEAHGADASVDPEKVDIAADRYDAILRDPTLAGPLFGVAQ